MKDLGSIKGAGLPAQAEARLEQWRLRIRELHTSVQATETRLRAMAQEAEAPAVVDEPDLTPPPTPGGVAVTAGLSFVFIETEEPAFEQGHGYLRTLVYGAKYSGSGALPTFANAVKVHEFVGSVGSFASDLGTRWHLWLAWVSGDGVESSVPAGGTNGFQATTGKVGTADLNDLVVTAAKLADGAITAAKVAAQAIDATKFANGIEPVAVVPALPSVRVTSTVFNSADGKLYRWSGSAYVATVPAADLVGQVGTAQIADATLTTAKFAAGLRPVEIVSALPGSGNFEGRMAYLTTDAKLYRHNGTAWTSSVPTSDLAGQVAGAQIADGAISAIKTSIAAINAATGGLNSNTVDAAQIIANAVTALKLASGAVTAAKTALAAIDPSTGNLTANSVTATQIAAAAVTAAKIAADTITGNEIAANAIGVNELAAGAVTTAKLAAGAVTTTALAAGAVTANEIAAGAVVAGKIAAGAVSTTELAAGVVTTAKLAAGAVTANEIAANTITGGKIAGNTVSGANMVAGAIGTNELAANAVTAGKIAAGAVTASQVAANAITTDKLLVTGRGRALNDDPACSDLSAWSIPQASAAVITGAGAPVGTTVLRATNGTQIVSRSFPVEAGKTYKVSLWARQVSGGGVLYVRLYCYNAAGTLISYVVTGITPTSGPLEGLAVPGAWTRYSGFIVPGGGSVFAQVFLHVNWATTGVTDLTDLRCEEYVGSDLIVDGAIVASKLAANAIAVGTAAIQNGAIVNAMLGDASISTAKIADAAIVNAKLGDASVTAAKIADANITTAKIADANITAAKIADANIITAKIADAAITNAKITGDLQSDNFASGSSGWRIRKSDGSAEFAAASIRGKLTTSQLEVGSVTANVIATGTSSGAALANTTDLQVVIPPSLNFALCTVTLNGGHCRVSANWTGGVGVSKSSAIAYVSCFCSVEELDGSDAVVRAYTSVVNTERWAKASAPIVPNNNSLAPNKTADFNFAIQFVVSGVTGVRKFRLVLWSFQGVNTSGAPTAPISGVVSGTATIIAQENRV